MQRMERITMVGDLAKCSMVIIVKKFGWATGIKGLTRGLATLPQGNQEPLAVKTGM